MSTIRFPHRLERRSVREGDEEVRLVSVSLRRMSVSWRLQGQHWFGPNSPESWTKKSTGRTGRFPQTEASTDDLDGRQENRPTVLEVMDHLWWTNDCMLNISLQ